MGARGPAKKPTALHKRNGTYRPGKHGGPALRVELPESPPDMCPVAVAQWNIIGRQLAEAGLVSTIDQTALRMLCESMALYLESCDLIKTEGLVVGGKTKYQHPAVGIRNKAWAQIVTVARQFGMTPSARTGLHLESKQEDDDVSKILNLKVVS